MNDRSFDFCGELYWHRPGRFPGTGLDRVGMALLGAIMMVVTGVISVPEAFDSIDFSTILLLYAWMVLSAQFRLGGFYSQVALSIAGMIRWMCRAALNAEEPPRVVGQEVWRTYDRWQSFKGLVLTLVLVALFFTPIPRELSPNGTRLSLIVVTSISVHRC